MTEEEWQRWPTPDGMTAVIKDTITRRKLRLFTITCCSLVRHLLPDEAFGRFFGLLERSAEGKAVADECDAAADELEHIEVDSAAAEFAACALINAMDTKERMHGLWQVWPCAALALEVSSGMITADMANRQLVDRQRGGWIETHSNWRFAALLREVVGNPFRPAAVDPAWLAWADGTVVKLAQAMYDEQRFAELPVLSDALTDGGCDDEALLSHLRSAGPHVRGCWALDVILGKE